MVGESGIHTQGFKLQSEGLTPSPAYTATASITLSAASTAPDAVEI
jgi:hypothetical protein